MAAITLKGVSDATEAVVDDDMVDNLIDWNHFHKECTAHLPSYARPLFIRVITKGRLQMTGTFKHQKSGLIQDGFNPERIKISNSSSDSNGVIDSKLYFYSLKDGVVLPLKDEIYTDIITGSIKL
jgi:hypothetical protein